MIKQRRAVRVVIPKNLEDHMCEVCSAPNCKCDMMYCFVESLRYAGLVNVEHRNIGNNNEDSPVTIIDILAPDRGDDKIWAESNAERMRSFGFNAASAPDMHVFDYIKSRDVDSR